MKLKKDAELVPSSDPWYDIIDGGYALPEDLLEEQDDIEAVQHAISLLQEYKELVIEEI